MEKKETVLINVSYLVELNEEELMGDNSTIDKITSKIAQDEQISINEKNIELRWQSTSTYILDPSKSNCGKCTNCGAWVTDMEKSNPIPELVNGATVDGNLLCDECLPSEHRWAF